MERAVDQVRADGEGAQWCMVTVGLGDGSEPGQVEVVAELAQWVGEQRRLFCGEFGVLRLEVLELGLQLVFAMFCCFGSPDGLVRDLPCARQVPVEPAEFQPAYGQSPGTLGLGVHLGLPSGELGRDSRQWLLGIGFAERQDHRVLLRAVRQGEAGPVDPARSPVDAQRLGEQFGQPQDSGRRGQDPDINDVSRLGWETRGVDSWSVARSGRCDHEQRSLSGGVDDVVDEIRDLRGPHLSAIRASEGLRVYVRQVGLQQ